MRAGTPTASLASCNGHSDSTTGSPIRRQDFVMELDRQSNTHEQHLEELRQRLADHASRLGVIDWEGFQLGLDERASTGPADEHGLVKIQGPYLAYLADFLRMKAAEAVLLRVKNDEWERMFREMEALARTNYTDNAHPIQVENSRLLKEVERLRREVERCDRTEVHADARR